MSSFYQLCDYFEYLDDLRSSGATNMFGAAPFLAERFDLEKSEARKILKDWQTSFSDDSLEDRVYHAKQKAHL